MVVVVCTRVFTASSPGSPGIPARNGFTTYIALSPEIGLSCLRRLRGLLRKLDASVEASGPRDFAVRVSAVRYRHLHVHRIPPRVRDDREPPLRWDGTAAICEVIWVGREGAIFLEMGLDTHPKSAAEVSSRTAGRLSSCGKRRKSTLHERRRSASSIPRQLAASPMVILRAHCIFWARFFIVEKSLFKMQLAPKITTKQTTAFLPT
jgi:hypothetical protein